MPEKFVSPSLDIAQGFATLSEDFGTPNHIGLIVPDFDKSIASYSSIFGWKLADIQTIKSEFWINGAVAPVEFRLAWTLQGPPHIEFLEMIPGTPFEQTGVHHIAYWVDDLAAAVERMKRKGLKLELTRLNSEKQMPFRFAYMVGPDGVRVELMDRAIKPGYEAYLSRGIPLGTPI